MSTSIGPGVFWVTCLGAAAVLAACGDGESGGQSASLPTEAPERNECYSVGQIMLRGPSPEHGPEGIEFGLNLLGYDAGEEDGVPDETFRAAVLAFQADEGLEPTGEIDDESAEQIYARFRVPDDEYIYLTNTGEIEAIDAESLTLRMGDNEAVISLDSRTRLLGVEAQPVAPSYLVSAGCVSVVTNVGMEAFLVRPSGAAFRVGAPS